MSTLITVLVTILILGILITVHELGHFLAAKALGIKVNEFAIGMGPAIFKRKGKETLFALRCIPLGGYCAMEGEDADTGDPRAFSRQKAWKRLIVLAAGSLMNFFIGFLAILILYMGPGSFYSTKVESFVGDYQDPYVQTGDVLFSLDGERLYSRSDFTTFVQRTKDGVGELVVLREGKKLSIPDWPIPIAEIEQDGNTVRVYALRFGQEDANVGSTLKYTWYSALNFVRLVRLGLQDLITGNAGLKDMQGVVGIGTMIGQVAQESANTLEAVKNVTYFSAFIAINLSVMNMLPIPALDGGRIFFLAVSWVVEKIRRGKKLDPKYEGYIHAAGLVLLLGLMAYVMFNDVVRLFR